MAPDPTLTPDPVAVAPWSPVASRRAFSAPPCEATRQWPPPPLDPATDALVTLLARLLCKMLEGYYTVHPYAGACLNERTATLFNMGVFSHASATYPFISRLPELSFPRPSLVETFLRQAAAWLGMGVAELVVCQVLSLIHI